MLAVELSSFQLEWSPSVRPFAGAVLNLAEDHLDWHGSMAAYGAAKARVLRGDVAVAGLDDREAAALLIAAPAPRHVGFTRGEPGPGELGIVDGHLVDRAFGGGSTARPRARRRRADVGPPGRTLATPWPRPRWPARTGWRPRRSPPVCARSRPARTAAAVVAEAGGVRWVDDSKATNPHAAAASLAAHPRVVWVAGGLLKGADVGELVVAHRDRLAGAVVLGRDRDRVHAALARHAPEVPVLDVGGGDDGPVSDDRQDPDAGMRGMTRAARAAPPWPGPATPCCSPPRRRPWTCSATTRRGATRSPPPRAASPAGWARTGRRRPPTRIPPPRP